jgi:hypothetical protein
MYGTIYATKIKIEMLYKCNALEAKDNGYKCNKKISYYH